MVEVVDLLLPIVLSSVLVFVVSSVIHMVLTFHKSDFKKLPAEDAVLQDLRARGIPPGLYVFPCARSMQEMKSPEVLEKRRRGPVGFLTILPSGEASMGASLVQWFLLTLVVGLFAAYVGGLALGPGASVREVLRITSTVAFAGYALGTATDSIWKGVPWAVTLKLAVDGLVYALVTGATFAWLWPDA
jgi:hypothetical protein